MGDDDGRTLSALFFYQEVFEALDTLQIQVVGRFIEQQHVGLERQGQGEGRALALPPRTGGRIHFPVEREALQELLQQCPAAPVLAIVLQGAGPRARDQALHQVRGGGQFRFLFHEHDAQPVAQPHFAGVQGEPARDGRQQRRLAAAVAADETDALPLQHGQRRGVEERRHAEGQFGLEYR